MTSPAPPHACTAEHPAVIIGAGPAGLAAGVECVRRGVPAVVLERSGAVGGLCRTVERDGFRFDVGGHRFFTKNAEVEALWRETLGDDFLVRPRRSRIYFGGRFFAYPLRPMSALLSMGPVETVASLASFLWTKLTPSPPAVSFEDWASSQFGPRLYRHFFRDYTEKVWGIPCSDLVSEWGAQRIKGLSLGSVIRAALLPSAKKGLKTLIDEFEYPRLGPGQMFAAWADQCVAAGVEVRHNRRVVRLETEGDRIAAVIAVDEAGLEERIPCGEVISTMPITELVKSIDNIDADARSATDSLGYRALITVNLLLDQRGDLDDTWIYVHDPALKIGRVQFFHNWSPAMVPDEQSGAAGLEIFADEGGEDWLRSDKELIAMATAEADALGLVDPSAVRDAFVLRAPGAYPLLRVGYEEPLGVVQKTLAAYANLQVAGRYGMFRYNNMDHSILTGLYAARNLAGESYDLWRVNADAEYLEEGSRPAT